MHPSWYLKVCCVSIFFFDKERKFILFVEQHEIVFHQKDHCFLFSTIFRIMILWFTGSTSILCAKSIRHVMIMEFPFILRWRIIQVIIFHLCSFMFYIFIKMLALLTIHLINAIVNIYIGISQICFLIFLRGWMIIWSISS